MLKLCMLEPSKVKGSIGMFFVMNAINKIGYKIDYLNENKIGYDIELISLHHCTDFIELLKIPKLAKIRIIGGHPMQNNPRPIIRFCDIVCIGEGETWIQQVIQLLEKNNLDIDCLKNLDGTIINKYWIDGGIIPKSNIENPLPDNPPYLNFDETNSKAWYIEIARGCPFRCYYCELGHSTKYRFYSLESIKKTIDKCDFTKTKKVNIFAPDEASHPNYNEIIDYIDSKGYQSSFASMRVDSVLKNNIKIPNNKLIRIGIDGLTEKTRFKVNKKINNEMIYQYFKTMLLNGHCNFKIFMIFGYEWEVESDFDEFENLMKSIFRLPFKKNVHLRIKWTPFIPQPITTLANSKSNYSYEIVQRINQFHIKFKTPYNNIGFYLVNDGLMSEKTHKNQILLSQGDENILNEFS